MRTDREKEQVLSELAIKAGENVERFNNCAQGTLLALQECFQFGNDQCLKAATALPGIALRGETCGAVLGAIMGMGLAFAGERLGDFSALQRTAGEAREFCQRFEEEYGSCLCRDVQYHLFGRYFDLADPDDQAVFIEAGVSQKCCELTGAAVRISGEIILNNQGKL
jgi:C_GCAxxG_C_C family probable redox protein